MLRSSFAQRFKRTRLKSNAWAYQRTFLAVSPLDEWTDLREQFKEYGVVRVKNAISTNDAAGFLHQIKSLSQLEDDDYELVRKRRKNGISMVGGVTQNEGLWPLISSPELVRVLAEILGEAPKYMSRDIVGVNLNANSFHRDVQEQPRDATYMEPSVESQFDMVKTIFYFQSPGRMSYRFGFKPFSHLDLFHSPRTARCQDTVWIDVAPDDCVIFSPYLLHTGERLNGPKYMVVLSYGADTKYANEAYYRSIYGSVVGANRRLPPALMTTLRGKNMLMSGISDIATDRYFKEKLAQDDKPLSYANANRT